MKHYSFRTEATYGDWVRRFILFHDQRHPREMGEPEVAAFLTHLAVEGHVSASTQDQALSAILFLYKEVLRQEIGWLQNVERAKRSRRVPVVLTKGEVRVVLERLEGTPRLMASLLHGAGCVGRGPAVARQRGGFRLPANHRARWQGGREGRYEPSRDAGLCARRQVAGGDEAFPRESAVAFSEGERKFGESGCTFAESEREFGESACAFSQSPREMIQRAFTLPEGAGAF